jgi:hypothetical protein
MANETTMKRCFHVECGGNMQPHSLDSATGELDCDGPCSPRRVEAWKASLKQPTKAQRPKRKVCCAEPHMAFGHNTETEWIDCEAHGNEMPCPCGCGATQCNHVTEEELRADLWES